MPEAPNPFRRVLVQVDPTFPLKRSADFAAHLAKTLGAELVLLYVIDEKIAGMMGSDMYVAFERALGEVGEDALDTYARALGGGLRVSKHVGYGDTAATVAKFVQREGAQLAITGGYHHSVYQRIPFGSVVNDLIRRNPASTFLLRENHGAPAAGRPVLAPFDGSKQALRALYLIAPFAKALGMPVHVVNFQARTRVAEGDDVLAAAAEAERKMGIPMEKRVLTKPFFRRLPQAILAEARRIDAGLIALSRGGSRAGSAGTSPVVESLVMNTPRPILVIGG